MPAWNRWAACALLVMGAPGVASAQRAASASPWKLTGQYSNLYTRSRTVIPPAEDFALDLNRLRLRLQGELTERVSVDLQDDTELFVGNYLGTAQYALLEDRNRLPFDHDYVARDAVAARHRIYRATAVWSGPDLDVTIGRQRIPFGTGQFWSPLDLLNPFDATRLERDYRTGVDALRVERRLGALSRLAAVYAPATDRARASVAAYAHANVGGTDYSLLAGTFRGDEAIGADFAGDVGGLGIRGEATVTRPETGPSYGRALLGGTYGFPSTLTLAVELYYNGQGASDPADYDLAAVVAGRAFNVARHYAAVALSYEVTPLAEIALYAVLNGDDRSGVVWPRIEYSVAANIDVAAGLQGFVGAAETEYGRFTNLLHGEVRWFF